MGECHSIDIVNEIIYSQWSAIVSINNVSRSSSVYYLFFLPSVNKIFLPEVESSNNQMCTKLDAPFGFNGPPVISSISTGGSSSSVTTRLCVYSETCDTTIAVINRVSIIHRPVFARGECSEQKYSSHILKMTGNECCLGHYIDA